MIILDTNVISELFRPAPDDNVITWIKDAIDGDVAITAITLAELLTGLRRLPEGKRRSTLTANVETALEPYRDTRAILPFDDKAAEQYADVLIAREQAGLPIHTADAQIAAICRAHGAICATRNTSNFTVTGVKLFNPWTGITSA